MSERSEYDEIKEFIQDGPGKNYNQILLQLEKTTRQKFQNRNIGIITQTSGLEHV